MSLLLAPFGPKKGQQVCKNGTGGKTRSKKSRQGCACLEQRRGGYVEFNFIANSQIVDQSGAAAVVFQAARDCIWMLGLGWNRAR